MAKEVGGEPLVVGKIVKNADGKMKLAPITESTAAPSSSSSSGAVAMPAPKKKESGSGSGSASGTGGVAKSKP